MKQTSNFTGQKIGILTVIKRSNKVDSRNRAYWVCSCDCGGKTEIRADYLATKSMPNCGCLNKKRPKIGKYKQDLTGQKFGKLVVLKHSYTGNSRDFWECLCECGNNHIVMGYDLKNKRRDCGCERVTPSNKSLVGYQSGFSNVFRSYKRGAKLRGFDFNLSKEEAIKIFKENCHYCGSEPKNCSMTDGTNVELREKSKFLYNGIDRVNPNSGYSIDNCVSACKRCNIAKSDMSYSEFMSLIQRIYNRMKDKI